MAISNNSTGLRPGVCTSTTRPTAPYEGQHIYETDTDIEYVWNGSAWVVNYVSAASPAFTGTPTAPTATAGTNTTQIATTAFVNNAPRGIIAVTSSVSNTITGGVLTGLTTTFTAVANRYYRISVLFMSAMPVAGNRVVILITGGSARTVDYTCAIAGFDVLYGSTVQTYAAASQTIQVTVANIVGTTTANAATGAPHQLIIEDVGGV